MPDIVKIFLLFFACFMPRLCAGNMASPIQGGTPLALAFSSKNVDILHEEIVMKLFPSFDSATFDVNYTIQTAVGGRQIPLLFIAENYSGEFRISIDDQRVALRQFPGDSMGMAYLILSGFSNAFDTSDNRSPREGRMDLRWHHHQFRLTDCKYFELTLSKGIHRVHVSYLAAPESDLSDWIATRTYNYSLAPARHWKSFGRLNLVVDARGLGYPLTTNLRPPDSGSLNGLAVWHFEALPADFFAVAYSPQASFAAQKLIAIGPWGLALVLGIILVILHIWAIVAYRKKYPAKKTSLIMILGGLLLPLIFLISGIYCYDLIDSVIGKDASRRHGYEGLAIFFYVLIMPVYFLVVLWIDLFLRKRDSKKLPA